MKKEGVRDTLFSSYCRIPNVLLIRLFKCAEMLNLLSIGLQNSINAFPLGNKQHISGIFFQFGNQLVTNYTINM